MYEQLEKYWRKVTLTAVEFDMCKTFLFKKNTEKQTLLLEGDICTYNAFIEKGILRSY
jgi:hypothetical protein